jgi:hypothetical protein
VEDETFPDIGSMSNDSQILAGHSGPTTKPPT